MDVVHLYVGEVETIRKVLLRGQALEKALEAAGFQLPERKGYGDYGFDQALSILGEPTPEAKL